MTYYSELTYHNPTDSGIFLLGPIHLGAVTCDKLKCLFRIHNKRCTGLFTYSRGLHVP